LQKILTKYSKINKKTGKFAKRFGKLETPTKGMKATYWSMHVLKKTWPLWMNW